MCQVKRKVVDAQEGQAIPGCGTIVVYEPRLGRMAHSRKIAVWLYFALAAVAFVTKGATVSQVNRFSSGVFLRLRTLGR